MSSVLMQGHKVGSTANSDIEFMDLFLYVAAVVVSSVGTPFLRVLALIAERDCNCFFIYWLHMVL